VYGVWCTVYGVQCTVWCTVYGTVYGVRCTVYGERCTVRCRVYGTVYGVGCTVRCTVYGVGFAVYGVGFAACGLRFALYGLRFMVLNQGLERYMCRGRMMGVTCIALRSDDGCYMHCIASCCIALHCIEVG
jgi:hypothetical protein